MKRKFLVRISLLLSLGCCITYTKAHNTKLYAYTITINDYDDYVYEKAGEFILVQNYEFDYLDVVLGRGIYIFGDDNTAETMIYPVFYNGTVLGEIVVGKDNGEIIGTYCEAYNNVLNSVSLITTNENPLRIVLVEDSIEYYVGDSIYMIVTTNTNNQKSNDIIAKDNKMTFTTVCVSDGMEYQHKYVDRYPSVRINTWNIYSYMGAYLDTYKPYSPGLCYAHCLFNIFKNLGINTYSSVGAVAAMAANNAAKAYISTIGPNLISAGFSCTYSNSGNLSFSSVVNTIYNNNNYVFMGNQLKYSGSNSWIDGHATVIYGYYNVSGSYYYYVWDPAFPNGGSGAVTMSSSSTTFYSADGLTQLKWNLGYIRNIY